MKKKFKIYRVSNEYIRMDHPMMGMCSDVGLLIQSYSTDEYDSLEDAEEELKGLHEPGKEFTILPIYSYK